MIGDISLFFSLGSIAEIMLMKNLFTKWNISVDSKMLSYLIVFIFNMKYIPYFSKYKLFYLKNSYEWMKLQADWTFIDFWTSDAIYFVFTSFRAINP